MWATQCRLYKVCVDVRPHVFSLAVSEALLGLDMPKPKQMSASAQLPHIFRQLPGKAPCCRSLRCLCLDVWTCHHISALPGCNC